MYEVVCTSSCGVPPSLTVVGALEGVVSMEVSTPPPSDETPHKHSVHAVMDKWRRLMRRSSICVQERDRGHIVSTRDHVI